MSSTAPDTEESPANQPTHSQDSAFDRLRERLDSLEAALERKDERLDELEADRDRLEERCTRLEEDRDRLAETVARLGSKTDDLESRTDDLESSTGDLESRTTDLESDTARLENFAEAVSNKTNANKARIAALQSRELEKGAHLRADQVDAQAVTVADGRLERIEKEDGHAYYRLPECADPLERGGDVSLAFGDLLPIQQLARMDADRRRAAASSLPTRLAAKLWQARTDPSVGDDPWERGCKNVAEYVKASDLRHWIRRQEPGISESYAKKLVSRTIDAVLDLSKNRLAVRRKTERKNGLEYTERRLVLPADAAVPGVTNRDDSATSRDENRTNRNDGTTNRKESTDSSPSDPETPAVHG